MSSSSAPDPNKMLNFYDGLQEQGDLFSGGKVKRANISVSKTEQILGRRETALRHEASFLTVAQTFPFTTG